MPRLALIAAISENGVIGDGLHMPWGRAYKRDLQHFKDITTKMGNVIMGRKTAQSLVKPLPGRKNFVLSRTGDDVPPHFTTLWTPGQLLEHTSREAWVAVIGGAEIYRLLAPFCSVAYITRIHENFSGDVLFPFDALTRFDHTKTLNNYPADADNPHDLTIYQLKNREVHPLTTTTR